MYLLRCLFLLPLTACTLVGLDDFDRCDELGSTVAEQEAACANALNAEIGAPAGCRPFRCVDGECVQQDIELCDGSDNDCDGAVDEDIFTPSNFASISTESAGSELSIASDGTETRAFWIEGLDTPAAGGASAALRPTIDAERSPLAYFTHPNGGDARALPGAEALVEGCWRKTLVEVGDLVSVEPAQRPCGFFAMESSRSGQNTLIATLDDRGCDGGRLRLGHISAPGQLAVTGPLARSNSFMGIALTADGECSATRPSECQEALDADTSAETSCTSTSDCVSGECLYGFCRSAENVAVAVRCGFADFAMDTVAAPAAGNVLLHGLLAAVSGSRTTARCRLPDFPETTDVDESLRDVAIFGSYLHQQQDFTFVNAANEGAPTILTPQTTGVGAPGVLGVGDSFIVAYPSPTQTLAVHFVGPLAEPPSTDVANCDPAALGSQTCASPQEPVCQRTFCGSDIGICNSGIPRCIGGSAFCEGVRNPDAVEECGNELDDDCDGRTDESSCEADRSAMATPEICNGADDDFDGVVDEDATGRFDLREPLANPRLPDVEVRVGDVCGDADGACRLGTVACVGGRLLCEGAIAPRTDPERAFRDLCGSGLDDDCDGVVSVGDCSECVAMPAERCNGRDDDCNGIVDEGTDDDVLTDSELGLSPGPTSRDKATVRQCAPTPALGEGSSDAVEGFSMAFDDVVLSLGPRDDQGLNVGVAYRELMDDGLAQVSFRIVKLHVDCSCRAGGSCGEVSCDEVLTPTGVRSSGDPVELSAAPGDYGPPTIAFAPDGFRAAQGEQTGGWYVLWTSPEGPASTLVGQRIALENGMPVDSEPFVASVPDGPSGAQFPRAYSDDQGAGYAFAERSTRRIVSGHLVCDER